MKIHLVGAELLHVNRQTNRQKDMTKLSHILQFCDHLKKE